MAKKKVVVPPGLVPLLEPMSSLAPNPANVKKNHDVGEIAAALREHGWHAPIVATEAGVIVIGHGRYKAARRIGLTEVPVLRIPDGEVEAYRRMISDNRTSELSDWDEDAFKRIVEEVGEGVFASMSMPLSLSTVLALGGGSVGPDGGGLDGEPAPAGCATSGAAWEIVVSGPADPAGRLISELGTMEGVSVRRLY